MGARTSRTPQSPGGAKYYMHSRRWSRPDLARASFEHGTPLTPLPSFYCALDGCRHDGHHVVGASARPAASPTSCATCGSKLRFNDHSSVQRPHPGQLGIRSVTTA
jgi:hypothetical protein